VEEVGEWGAGKGKGYEGPSEEVGRRGHPLFRPGLEGKGG
jgi:hypothetical protein